MVLSIFIKSENFFSLLKSVKKFQKLKGFLCEFHCDSFGGKGRKKCFVFVRKGVWIFPLSRACLHQWCNLLLKGWNILGLAPFKKFHCFSRWRCSPSSQAAAPSTKHVAEKRAEIFGANFITEYMLYSHPFSVSPTSGLFFTAPFFSWPEC